MVRGNKNTSKGYNIMGNRTEFLAYYRDFKDKIYNYFWYRLNFDRAIAEDLTSEVFLKALEHFEDFDQARSFQAWIYAIAHNHLLNFYRSAGREVSIESAAELGRFEHKKIEAKIELERVLAAVVNLPEYCREVIILRFVDGLENAEIAACLNKEEGAVRVQISRALAMLKEHLKEPEKKQDAHVEENIKDKKIILAEEIKKNMAFIADLDNK
jgi:RNA polymerase sigma-70 factor, ECF subfamily